ncbi:unnamed protein product [Euphydryas editha]|uniref:Uncharacterized protein n=1 Tax=Euphydryas editha TaxID=104508 RepID=A0AAU9VAA4_EUPED|nr:unnamed protein product [Euphydryas editha]
MTKTVFLFSLLCCFTKAEYSVRCNNSSRSGLTFEPSSDGVEGRYTVDWCTTADRNVTNWELSMRYDDTRAPEQCKKFDIRYRPGRVHSRFDRIVDVDLNCTDVCFSTNLDLVFNGSCYHIKSWIRRGSQSSTPHDSVHYIINQSVKEHFTLSEARVAEFSNNEQFEVHWYLGYVPVTEFQVELCTEDFLCPCLKPNPRTGAAVRGFDFYPQDWVYNIMGAWNCPHH